MDIWINHPRCAILPSPEKLNTSPSSPALDETNTRQDFDNVWQWLTSSEFLNTGFYKFSPGDTITDGLFEPSVYKTLINLAFIIAFNAIRETGQPESDEMVLLYYTGHGLGTRGANRLNERGGQSSNPLFEKLNLSNHREYFQDADVFVTKDRCVKGGELLLHDVGYCDLQGILTPWIAAVKKDSMNAPGKVKKNKHLVVIADSCHSGTLVEDLRELKRNPGPWNENDCSVTVQSACMSNEETDGGYFTPVFLHFNKPENQQFLQVLKYLWNGKSEIEKNAYRALKLPSPEVETTMPSERLGSEEDPVLVLPCIQGFQLTLFSDPEFFKFCFLSLSGIVNVGSNARALTSIAADTFLTEAQFNIIDYKLKKMLNGTPMALVLMDDPKDPEHVVCVHIHFNDNNTSIDNVSGVNLIHHNRPTEIGRNGHLFLEATPRRKQRFNPEEILNLKTLVEQCKIYVNDKEHGKWENYLQWNMEDSFHNMFRLGKRSEWMDLYVDNARTRQTPS